MTICSYTEKTSRKNIKYLVTAGLAKDITNLSSSEVDELRKNEHGFRTLCYSAGVYGCNGLAFYGCKTNTLYCITKRCSNLFKFS